MKVYDSHCLPALIIVLLISSPIDLAAERILQSTASGNFVKEVPKDQRVATILEIKVLCKQPGRYIGWPSIVPDPPAGRETLPDGNPLATEGSGLTANRYRICSSLS